MSRRNVILALCGVAVLLAAGGLFASNMGFKLNYSLVTGASGTNTLSLPYNRQIGIDNAEQLLDDIDNTGTPLLNALNVQRWVPATDAIALYSKAPSDPAPFLLDKGVGYYTKVTAPVSYIVVGSHDPGYSHTLLAAGGVGGTASGTNFYSVPYHTTVTNADQLRIEINTTGAPAGNVVNIQRWNPLNDVLALYSGAPSDPAPFPVTPGEAYFVKLGPASNVSYVPSHY